MTKHSHIFRKVRKHKSPVKQDGRRALPQINIFSCHTHSAITYCTSFTGARQNATFCPAGSSTLT